MLWCLEARKQVDQEGMMGHIHDLKDALLAHQTGEGGEKSWEGGEERGKSPRQGGD